MASAARHIAPAQHLGLGFGAVAASSRTLLTTLQLVWRERADIIHARKPFPVGGVVEDSATGAAAAALGGYLRDAGLIDTPARFTVRQGEDMGHPSLLRVDAPTDGGVRVTGTAIGI